LLGALVFSALATAQRVDENPVTAADDAFGTTVGSQTIGLYDADNVRGFSPRDAGNLRIEGLYFDQETFAADSCLVSAQSIKVGLAAQSFNFPAPTGIANFSVRVPESGKLTSVVVARGPFEATALELDGQYGTADQPVSVSVCFHRNTNSDFDFARRAQNNDAGLIVRAQLPRDLELITFGGTSRGNEHSSLPFVYTDGVEGVPTFRQMRLPMQSVKYQRAVDAPGEPTAMDKSNPALPTARFTLVPGSNFLAYGSYTRGWRTRHWHPPTRQTAGNLRRPRRRGNWTRAVRYTPRSGAQFLLGAFEVNKAYFSLDSAGVYSQLGTYAIVV